MNRTRTTNLWNQITQTHWIIYAAMAFVTLYIPAVILALFKVDLGVFKLLTVVMLGLLVLLFVRYQLYRKPGTWLILTFLAWMIGVDFLRGASVNRAFGGEMTRAWYIGLIFLSIGYLAEDRARRIWIRIWLRVALVLLSVASVYIIYHAISHYLDASHVTNEVYGLFQNGRLSGYGNANTIGCVAGTQVLMGTWLAVDVSHSPGKLWRRTGGSILYAALTFLAIWTLSLSRSRGAMISTSAGLGSFAFSFLLSKWGRGKKMALSVAISVIALPVFFFLIAVPKQMTNVALTSALMSRDSAMTEEAAMEKLQAENLDYALDTLSDRTLIWKATFEMMDEDPSLYLFGASGAAVGQTAIQNVYAGRPELTAVHAHSGYLQILLLFGVPGALLLMILLVRWSYAGAIVIGNHEEDFRIRLLMAFALMLIIYGVVEAYPFPNQQIYPGSLLFFYAVGLARKRAAYAPHTVAVRSHTKFYRVLKIGGVIAASILAVVVLCVKYQAKKQERAEWISAYNEAQILADDVLMTRGEIAYANYVNRRMISTGNARFALNEVGERFNGRILRQLIADTSLRPENPENYTLGGVSTPSSYWEEMDRRTDVIRIPRAVDTQYGCIISGCMMKRWPCSDVIIDTKSAFGYDEMDQSNASYGSPVVILWESSDHEWVYILGECAGGWVRKEYVALCADKEEWVALQNPLSYLVVTGVRLELSATFSDGHSMPITVPMGARLEIISGNTVRVFGADTEGKLIEGTAVVPKDADVSYDYLAMTQENILAQANKFLGEEYGWAGVDGQVDCSLFTKEVYACFGLTLPRTAAAQIGIKEWESKDVSRLSDAQKQRLLATLPIGSLLYFPDHIMIYTGMVDGHPTCISAVGFHSTKELPMGELVDANVVELSDLTFNARANGKTWLQALEKILRVDTK